MRYPLVLVPPILVAATVQRLGCFKDRRENGLEGAIKTPEKDNADLLHYSREASKLALEREDYLSDRSLTFPSRIIPHILPHIHHTSP